MASLVLVARYIRTLILLLPWVSVSLKSTYLKLTLGKDSQRYADGGLCGKQVEIVNLANGKSVKVTIADSCPTCHNDVSIDLSVSAFEALADLSVGELNMKWQYV
jgi:hypothetical protein